MNPAASELILEWETGEARSEKPRAEGGANPLPIKYGLGSAVSSPRGSGVETRPPKGFLAFCAIRLPLLAPHLFIAR